MSQTTLKTKAVAAIGEEIGLEMGTQMVREFQETYPTDTHSYIIGRNIIEQILAQPGCEGIQFFNAINETGEKTLVYVGVDKNSNPLLKISIVSKSGNLSIEKAIVADRVRPGGMSIDESESNEWTWMNS